MSKQPHAHTSTAIGPSATTSSTSWWAWSSQTLYQNRASSFKLLLVRCWKLTRHCHSCFSWDNITLKTTLYFYLILIFRVYQWIGNIHWQKCVCSPLKEKTQWWAFSTCLTWRDPYPQNHVGLNFTVMLMFFETEKSLRPCEHVDSRTGSKNHVLRKCLCKNLRVVWPIGFQRNLRTKPLCFLYEAFSATLFQGWEKKGLWFYNWNM